MPSIGLAPEVCEDWCPVIEFPAYYEISSHGRVRSIARFRRGRNGSRQRIQSRILKLDTSEHSLRARMSVEGKTYTRTVARLVAEAFIGPVGKSFVGYHDSDPHNVTVANLFILNDSELYLGIRSSVRRVNLSGTMTCRRCNMELPRDAFIPRGVGLIHPCKRCRSDIRYNFTPEMRRDWLQRQGFTCANLGCDAKLVNADGTKFSYVIDHDHGCCSRHAESCGKCIRGLTCANCNLGFGSFRDEPDIVAGAERYLLSTRDILRPMLAAL